MDVYKVINAVHKELAKIGIQKSDRNNFDKYNFRGIDAVYNTVSPILANHGLLILQRVLSCNTVERVSQKGGALYFTTVDVEFDLVSASDGSKHTIKTYGEGMDRSDKSVNKALTAAYKYALFQAFCIPVEGSPDADSEGHDVAPTKPKPIMVSDEKFTINKHKWAQLAKSAGQGGLESFQNHMLQKHNAVFTTEQFKELQTLIGDIVHFERVSACEGQQSESQQIAEDDGMQCVPS